MENPIIIGLTGGIGSGKSFVASLLTKEGIPVYDSDREAKRLMNSQTELIERIQNLLGPGSHKDGNLDRAYVASRIFGNRELLHATNELVHPAVRQDFLNWATSVDSRVVVQETALIFENHMESFYHRIALVTAPISLRLARLRARDQLSNHEFMRRIQNQLPDAPKLKACDFCIRNTLRSETIEQVRKMAVFLSALQL